MRTKFPVTVHLLFFRDHQVLLLRRFKTGYEDGNYSVPAGHLDGGETVREAAAREAFEEAGIRIHVDKVVFATVMQRKSDDTPSGTGERIDFFVHITAWEGEPFNAEPEKCDDLSWWNINALPENVIPYVRRAIGNYLAGIPFDEFGWDG
jgi:8-oxo-dGTP pyrophosphatase MutT (NUDIX family)